MNINEIMKQLAEYIRIEEEAKAIADSLRDQIKDYMTQNGVDTLAGNEHKATYKAVTSSRIDTTAIKKNHPDIAAQFTVTSTSRRFTFA